MPSSTSTSLLELPNEATYSILEYLSPKDAFNFSLTCKQIRSFEATQHLQAHRELQKTYTNLQFSDCDCNGTVPGDHPLTILKALITDPSIRFYPRSLLINPCSYLCLDDEDLDDEKLLDIQFARGLWEECWEKVLTTMSPVERTCLGDWYNPDSDREDSSEEYDAFYKIASYGALLTLLPNLEVITLSGYEFYGNNHGASNTLKGVIWRIAESHLDPEIVAPKPLTRLREVTLARSDNYWYPRDVESDNFGTFAAFGLLPAMRVLSGLKIVISDSFPNLLWPFHDHISFVTEINLQRSNVGPEALRRLLERLPGLRSFTYDYAGDSHSIDENTFSPIIKALRERTANTLEYLALTSNTSPNVFKEDEAAAARCLKDFQVLRELKFPARIFLGGLRKVARNPEARGTLHLINILPSSIQTVQIDGTIDNGGVAHILHDLPGLKEKCFPNLTNIHFTSLEPSLDVKKCQKVGVTLQLREANK